MSGVDYRVREGIAEITLDAPPANALTRSTVVELIAALDRAAADDAVAVVLVRSAVARRFCAGLDLTQLDGTSPAEVRSLLETLYVGLHQAQRRLGKPSIAVVNGAARGGGVTLAVSCDLLVAGESASFGYPEIDVGVMPAIHFTLLPRIVGRHRAFDLLFTGRTFGASTAEALGLVSRVVPDDELDAAARSLARVLAAKPRQAMRIARESFHRALDLGMSEGIGAAVEDFCVVAATDDAREGIGGFAKRRAAARGGPTPQQQEESNR